MELTGKEKSYLRGRSHDLKPLVKIGKKGINENLITNLMEALEKRELVKVSTTADRKERKEQAETLSKETGATVVQIKGKTILFYLPNPENPKVSADLKKI